MMKKRSIKIIFILLISFAFNVKDVFADKTLGDLKGELAALRQEKAENDYQKSMTQDEINSQNNAIAESYAAIEQAENDIEVAKTKIEESNNKIEKTKDESADLLVFYEIMNGDNAFLEYVSGATTMTDLLMRSETVSQILGYNKEKLNELENLITENEELQVELKNKEEELNNNIETYKSKVTSLKSDLSSLVEMALDYDDQISAQSELIKYYEDIGCKDNQLLSECEAALVNNARWLMPTEKGYISSTFGYRSFYLNGRPYSDYHPAIDIAGIPGGTNVYAAAGGKVAAIIRQASCGGNQVYIHVMVQGQKYTLTYAHLLDVYVNVGDTVTNQSIIGTVGGGGRTLRVNGGWDTCSTGYHLHFGTTYGYYLGDGYSSYSQYVANSFNPPMLPAYGSWYYSRYA